MPLNGKPVISINPNPSTTDGKSVDAASPDPANGPSDRSGETTDGGGSSPRFEPVGTGTSDSGSSPKRKSGWPKGKPRKPQPQRTSYPNVEPVSYPAAAGTEKETVRKNLADWTGVILSAHAILACVVKEFELTEEEARKLSDASKEVAKHYSIGLTDKQLAWFNLTLVAGNLYGPRVIAFGIRKGSERRAKVVPIRPGPGPGQAPGPSAAPPTAAPVNGSPGIDLTPAFMTAPPVGEEIP